MSIDTSAQVLSQPPTQLHVVAIPESVPNAWSSTDVLFRDLTVRWLRHADQFECALQLSELDSFEGRPARLAAIELLGRATLQLDVRALSSVSATIEGKDQATRACVVSILGEAASTSWHEVEEPVRKLIERATIEQHLAESLVTEATKVLSQRQTNPDFAKWIADAPDGIAGYAWTVALRVAGEWLWDRNLAKIHALGERSSDQPGAAHRDLNYRPGSLRVRRDHQDISPTAADAAPPVNAVDDQRIAPWQPVGAPRSYDPFNHSGTDAGVVRGRHVRAPWIENDKAAQESAHVVITQLPSMLLRRRASATARTIAVDTLLQSAVSSDPASRANAWDDAMAKARHDPHCAAWTAELDAIRDGAGEPAWAAANQSARASVQVLLNELPFVVDRIALITLANEACAAAARAVAIDAGAVAIAGLTDVKVARKAALAAMAAALDPA